MYPRAILFDLDNTLTHRALSIRRYAEQFMAEFGEHIRPATLDDITQLILQEDSGGYLSPQSAFASIREAVGHILASQLPWRVPQAAQVLVEHWVSHFPGAAVQMPGAAALIQVLERRNIKIGIVSNGAEHSRRKTIAALPFAQSVGTVVSSQAFGTAKPAREIFHEAAARLGVLPEHCWFVGDHPLNDYQGAKAAGMYAVWFQGFHQWPAGLAPAQHTIKSLDELPALIAKR